MKNKVVIATEYRINQDTNIVPPQDNDNNEIIETITIYNDNDIFIQKINEYSTVDVNNRPYLTSVNKKLSTEELKTINFIATKYIDSLKCIGDVTLDIIDNVIYSAVIAIKT